MTINHRELLEQFDREHLTDVILGRRLMQCREQAALTREDLATMSGIPIDELIDYEEGQIPIGLGRMRAIASALDTDVVTLMMRLMFPIS
ncbi:hypothetical protein COB72_05530 [bacterium]|nr:MAG: hypothetical protein COB72_05530 [bacterium]